jgi:hypothetical protein
LIFHQETGASTNVHVHPNVAYFRLLNSRYKRYPPEKHYSNENFLLLNSSQKKDKKFLLQNIKKAFKI